MTAKDLVWRVLEARGKMRLLLSERVVAQRREISGKSGDFYETNL